MLGLVIAVAILAVCSATALMMAKHCIQEEDIVNSWACAMTFGANFAMVIFWVIKLVGIL